MKAQLLIFMTIALFFGIVSCEQDNSFLQEADQSLQTQQPAPEGADDLHELMTDVQTFEHEQAAPELPLMDSTQTDFRFAEPFELEVPQESEIELRGGEIDCNTTIRESTIGQSNKVSSSVYQSLGLNANLNGGDQIYYFSLTEKTTVSFSLFNTANNMAMVLFRGTRNCAGYSCNYRLSEVVGRTYSNSIYGDDIADVELEAGTYILVVDGVAGRASNYDLMMNCTAIGFAAFYNLEDFQSYYAGHISAQSNEWIKWNNHATYDGQVVVDRMYKYLFMERKANVASTHQPDVIYKLQYADNDVYKVNFNLWVASNRSGYFSIQKRLSYNNSNNEFGAQVYFYNNGTGAVKIGGEFHYFNYQQGKWLDIDIDIRTDAATSHGVITIDGSHEVHFNASARANSDYGSLNVAGLGFYPVFTDSKFWVDNIEQTNL